MKFSQSWIVCFGVFVGLTGCLDANLERKAGPEVPASRAGLKVEWTQTPYLPDGGEIATYPFGAKLQQGEDVEMSVLRLTNTSSETKNLYFESPASEGITIGLETFCTTSPEEASKTIDWSKGSLFTDPNFKFPDAYPVLCRHESRWELAELILVREGGRTKALRTEKRDPKLPLNGMIDIRSGETVTVIANLRLSEGELIPTKRRTNVPLGDLECANCVSITTASLDENDRLAAEYLLSTSIEGAILPSIKLEDESPLYLEEAPSAGRRDFHTGAYPMIQKQISLGLNYVFRASDSGIPVFL